MHFEVDKLQKNRINYIDIVSGKEVISFTMKNYNRTKFINSFEFYDNVNKLVASLKKEEQDKLFNVYLEIKNAFLEVNDVTRLHKIISKLINQLLTIVSFDVVKSWFMLNGNIQIPPDLKDVFTGEDNDLTEKLTYLRGDYFDLSILSVLIKFITPIFGEYLDSMGREAGTKFKELRAFTLLNRSPMFKLPVFVRLQVYVDASLEKEKRKNASSFRSSAAIMGGLGLSELPTWLLSRAVVRKLSVHEELTTNSIIASVYHSIDQQISSMDKTFDGAIRDKKPAYGDMDGDKASIVENYKVKQSVSDGDLSVLNIYTRELKSLVKIVEPGIDMKLVDLCDANLSKRTHINISQHQITLTQWVLSKAISPRGIPALNKVSILKAIAGAQAILWHWGFNELALLMTAIPYYGTDTMAPASSRLSKKYIDTFEELYPHRQLLSKTITVRNSNAALKAIDKLSSDIIRSDWSISAPAELETLMEVNPKNKIHLVSAEIRFALADLIIRINNTSPNSKV